MDFITEGKVTVSFIERDEFAEYYKIKTGGGDVKVSFSEHMKDMYGIWTPTSGMNHRMPQWFARQTVWSSFCNGAPLLSAYNINGNSKVTISLSESFKAARLIFYVDDFHEKDEVFFEAEIPDTNDGYETILMIDRTERPLYDAVHYAAAKWSIRKEVPEKAYAPLYSSWYNFHQNPEQNALTSELKEASSLGFETVIIDDGWQFEGDGTSDYRKSGDWEVAKDKFPDFAGFVRDVHSFGMKLLLWFSVPFVGYETEAYKRFYDKLLYKMDSPINAGVLDVRYAEVRKFLCDIYTDFVRKYDIDGLKLDFIDSFALHSDSPAFCEEMDCATVEEAVVRLLDEIKESTEALKPGFLSEFRQNYIGPSILKYGNMLRVGDCAFDSVTNRVGIMSLRMGSEYVAIHSDMLLWSPDETIENCAVQLLNIIFSVPQISVRLSKITSEQKQLINNFTKYAAENGVTLTRSRLIARHPEANYSAVTAEGTDQNITVLYSDTMYKSCGICEDIWNATAEDAYCMIPQDFIGDITVRDVLGNIIESETDANIIKVPRGGCLSVRK